MTKKTMNSFIILLSLTGCNEVKIWLINYQIYLELEKKII